MRKAQPELCSGPGARFVAQVKALCCMKHDILYIQKPVSRHNTANNSGLPVSAPLLLFLIVVLQFFFFIGATALCVDFGLLHGFVTVEFSGMASLAPRRTPSLEDQELHTVWPLPFDLSGIGSPTMNLRTHQHSSPGYWGKQTSSPRQGCSPRGCVMLHGRLTFHYPSWTFFWPHFGSQLITVTDDTSA